MTAQVPLTRGFVALVDEDDLATVLAAGSWCVSVKSHSPYALRAVRRADGRWTTTRLHNFLTGWSYVDHVNGDGLDNRRCNLRPADQPRNGQNRGASALNTSGYKGVTWHKGGRKWMAQIVAEGQRYYLGLFVDPLEAARAYDAAARRLHGQFARLNFQDVA